MPAFRSWPVAGQPTTIIIDNPITTNYQPVTTLERTNMSPLPRLTRIRTAAEALAANVLYYGPPGVGKTAIIEQSYEHYFKLLASSMQEEDIAGLPYLTEVENRPDGRAKPRRHGFTTHRWFMRANALAAKGHRVGIIFDEVDKARRSVADTLLTFFASRELPDSDGHKRKLHPNVDIIAIANNAAWGGGDGISEPMQNRFAAVEFMPNINEWLKWARATFDETNPGIMKVLLQVAGRKMQLVEREGEGETLRITSPRSLAAALTVCLNKHEYSTPYANWDDRVRGWLTPGAATVVIEAFKAVEPRDAAAVDAALNVQGMIQNTEPEIEDDDDTF